MNGVIPVVQLVIYELHESISLMCKNASQISHQNPCPCQRALKQVIKKEQEIGFTHFFDYFGNNHLINAKKLLLQFVVLNKKVCSENFFWKAIHSKSQFWLVYGGQNKEGTNGDRTCTKRGTDHFG